MSTALQVVPTHNSPRTPVPVDEEVTEPLQVSRAHTLRRVLDGKFRLLDPVRSTQPDERLHAGPPRLYAATWLDRSQVAIRRCSRHPDPSVPLEEFDRQFDQACRALESLDHPAIPAFLTHGYDREHDQRYIVQSWVHGIGVLELRHALGRPLSPIETAMLLLPIADALVYGHDRGVLHGKLDADCIRLVQPHQGSRLAGVPSGLSLVGLCPERHAAQVQRELRSGSRPDTRPDTLALAEIAYGLSAGIGPRSLGLSDNQRRGITSIDTPDARWNTILDRVFSPGSTLRMRELRDLLVGLIVASPATLNLFSPTLDATVSAILADRPGPRLPIVFDGPAPDRPARPVGATRTATPPPPRDRDATGPSASEVLGAVPAGAWVMTTVGFVAMGLVVFAIGLWMP